MRTIEYLEIKIIPDTFFDTNSRILQIRVKTDKKIYNIDKVFPQDDFRSVYDRLIDCSKQILQTILKETPNE